MYVSSWHFQILKNRQKCPNFQLILNFLMRVKPKFSVCHVLTLTVRKMHERTLLLCAKTHAEFSILSSSRPFSLLSSFSLSSFNLWSNLCIHFVEAVFFLKKVPNQSSVVKWEPTYGVLHYTKVSTEDKQERNIFTLSCKSHLSIMKLAKQ